MRLQSARPVGSDISIKAEGEEPLTQPAARMLLQSVLADRFQLKVRHENKEVPLYGLVVAKGGSEVRENTPRPTAIITHLDWPP